MREETKERWVPRFGKKKKGKNSVQKFLRRVWINSESDEDNVTSAALDVSSICHLFLAPTIADVTAELLSTQAMAS